MKKNLINLLVIPILGFSVTGGMLFWILCHPMSFFVALTLVVFIVFSLVVGQMVKDQWF